MLKRGLLIFSVIALVLYLRKLVGVLWPFLISLVLAGILAIALDTANQWLRRRCHPRGLATVLLAFATVSLLGAMLAFTSITVMRELEANHALLKENSLEEGGWMAMVTQTADQFLDLAYTPLAVGFNFDRDAVPRDAIRTGSIEHLKGVSGLLENDAGIALGGSKSFWITGLLTGIFLYLLLQFGEVWITQLQNVAKGAGDEMVEIVHMWVVDHVRDTLTGAAFQGVLLGLGFWLAGVRSPVFLGSMCGLAALIPVVGSPLVWAPVAVSFFMMGDYPRAVALAGWGVLVVAGVDKIMKRFAVVGRDRQHPMLVALASAGGTYALGVLGVLLIPLALTLVAAVLNKAHELIP